MWTHHPLISGWMVLQFTTECSESWGEGRHDIGRSIELLRGKLSWGWIGSIETRCGISACCSNWCSAIDNIWLNYQKWAGGRQTLHRHAEEGLAKPCFPAQQKVLSLRLHLNSCSCSLSTLFPLWWVSWTSLLDQHQRDQSLCHECWQWRGLMVSKLQAAAMAEVPALVIVSWV